MKTSPALLKRVTDLLDASNALMAKEGVEARVSFLASAYGPRKRGTDEGMSFSPSKDSIIHVNEVHPIVRQANASLYSKDPDIIVKPRSAQWNDSAKKQELFANWAARRQDHHREITLALTSANLFHYGVIKLGVGAKGLPSLTYTHPLSFRGDPTQEMFEPESGRWCAFKYKRSLSALRASGLYEEDELDKVGEHLIKQEGSGWSEETTPVWLWENYLYERVEGKRKLLIVTGIADSSLIIREEPFTDVAGLPCRILQFAPSFNSYFPISPVELWIDQQIELNAIRSNQLIHSDRAQRKILYQDGMFDPEEIAKFESVEPLVAIATKGGKESAWIMEQANLNADVYQAEERIKGDIQRISGVGDMHIGGNQNAASRSATEASIVESSLRLRSTDRQDYFQRFLQSVYHGFLKLAQERLSEPMQIKIMDGYWVPIDKESLKGETDVEISVGSTMASDRKSEWDQALAVYEQLSQNPLIDPQKPLMYLLGKLPDIKDANSWLASPVLPPMAPAGVPGMPPGAPPGMPPMGVPPLPGNAPPLAPPGASPLQFASLLRGEVGGA